MSEFYNDKAGLEQSDDLSSIRCQCGGRSTRQAHRHRRHHRRGIGRALTFGYPVRSGRPHVRRRVVRLLERLLVACAHDARRFVQLRGLPKRFSYKLRFSDPDGGPRYAEEFFSGKPDFDSARLDRFRRIHFEHRREREPDPALRQPAAGCHGFGIAGPNPARGWRRAPATVTLSATDLSFGVDAIGVSHRFRRRGCLQRRLLCAGRYERSHLLGDRQSGQHLSRAVSGSDERCREANRVRRCGSRSERRRAESGVCALTLWAVDSESE